jgi:nitrite reductase/ring-hydroxylating ferredoxin subunit
MELNEKIGRNDFLKKIGFSGAALFALYTLESCTNETGVTPQPSANSIDITQYPALAQNGGYIVYNNMVVANNNGNYIAATLTCSHEGRKEITFRNGEWYCTAHGARFDTAGKGLNNDGKKGLTVYTTSLSGNILTINK